MWGATENRRNDAIENYDEMIWYSNLKLTTKATAGIGRDVDVGAHSLTL